MTPNTTTALRRRPKPKRWPARLKYYINKPWERLFGRPLFALGLYETFGEPPDWQRRITFAWNHLAHDTNTPLALLLLACCVALLVVWRFFAPGFYPDEQVEFVGLIFDVVFILVLFSFFEHRRQRRLDAVRQQEIIDDFKKWKSDEARFRIAGAIRRLVRDGKTNIDFGGIELSDFQFRRHDIKSIRGSSFYDGTWGEAGSRDRVVLTGVDFTLVDCREVIFSKFHPFGGFDIDVKFAVFTDCMFVYANLERAVFDGAHLEWTEAPPDDLGTYEEVGDGPPAFHQTYYPPFFEANLSGASFADVRFKRADFRGAEGVLECDFRGARGLDDCLFDDEETKQAVLSLAYEVADASKAGSVQSVE